MSREKFFRKINARLTEGQKLYGETGFAGPALDTVAEIEEELLDIAGWGYILWVKLGRLRSALADLEAPLLAKTNPGIIRVSCGNCGRDGWGCRVDDQVTCLSCDKPVDGVATAMFFMPRGGK